MSECFISLVAPDADMSVPRRLLFEYGKSLEFHSCFNRFEQELAGLPAPYAPPGGALFLAYVGQNAVGCIGIREASPGRAELKRLYVDPQFRSLGIGKSLLRAALGHARKLGYKTVQLDTLPTMAAARSLYRSFGFREIGGLSTGGGDVPIDMELELNSLPGIADQAVSNDPATQA